MEKITRYLLPAALVAMVGCATQTTLTDAEVESRYPQLSQLEASLQSADEQDVDTLSASLYQQAKKHYKDSLASAKSGGNKAMGLAQQAQASLDQANRSAVVARDELAIVLKARNRALSAAADKKNPKAFNDLEEDLAELGDMVASGDIADVREDRRALAKRYAQLELAALKNATAKDAEDRISEAKLRGAEDYAPRTLAQAASEVKLANRVLESDADAKEKAAGHAQKAYQLANRAIQITEIIKEFKQSDMTDEQIVLWYQTQLANAVAPVVSNPDFSQANKTLIRGLATDIQLLVNKTQEYEQTLEQTRQQYASEMAVNEAQRQLQSEFESRFRTIQNTFTDSEAEVYRQGNNVLIRSYGFSFPTGGSEIQSDNFPLLKKIIAATGQFPDSNIQVSGHTDNRGSDELNMTLSGQRADKVARFLVEVGNLAESRVSNIGYGKTRPVASNETREGRAANRRVEVLIINE